MFLLKKIVSMILLPPVSLLALAVLGLWIARRQPRLGHGLIALAIGSLWLLSTPSISHWLIDGLQEARPITAAQLASADAIVILGGGTYHNAPEYGGDTVSRLALERVRYGARLARESGLPVAVTGGSPEGGKPEAEAMREALSREFGITSRWVETSSRDTAENAMLLAPLLKKDGVKRIALVSHAWHQPRAGKLFTHQGLDVLPAPTGYSTEESDPFRRWLPGPQALQTSRQAMHEYLGLLAARLTQ